KVKPPSAEKKRNQVVAHLARQFGDLLAPPWRDRPVNIQEIETVLCKWKSHLHGRYPVGKDTSEVKHGLYAWGKCSETASKMDYELGDVVTRLQEGGWFKMGTFEHV